ncbi:DUF2243 domain-containing protein [Aliterella atlantica]|uniref:DUF2243 domain-containing protein n=1 Tax=Aliterella atlantica CENA595 TaxID=1618023 RepID=A0A0D8ZWC6_9CYAN|nr:DUF2243 domain-containing protein [Aliterella atlantica]KJH73060.1 hypothetical protein UH38_03050 [Aliterella atlantica CENA595]
MEANSKSVLRPLITAGVVLGIGLGGFVDGIVLHQILQWHHMLSSVRPPTTIAQMKVNMVWDGLFDAATWIFTVLGIYLLWQAVQRDDVPRSSNTLFGSILIGAGSFNVIEGIIDHQILGIHHVKPGANELIWDIGFIVLGAILVLVGWVLIQAAKKGDNAIA